MEDSLNIPLRVSVYQQHAGIADFFLSPSIFHAGWDELNLDLRLLLKIDQLIDPIDHSLYQLNLFKSVEGTNQHYYAVYIRGRRSFPSYLRGADSTLV